MAQEQRQTQQQHGKHQQDAGQEELQAQATTSAQQQAQLNEVDDLLDEIDGVLETNAEEFVRGFVQKGGQ
ncbi:ubiquitin-like protein Pup [Zhihengliuella halotolerans]|uniref:Prokaryotic ubiquitin-like protein Pup n=1 Tax=Zhihengliuella halotolerans TaxID=370736 RepID=A0A4Q8AB81_9MICC|nr:ubiquitin-like protein Pup [Zhihengliuella halotolerans]RZU61407.1 ubiquitin-like protein Pup [Zhihengliuella halotolerans]